MYIFTRGITAVDNFLRDAGGKIYHAPLKGEIDPASVWRLKALLQKISNKENVVIHTHRYRDAFTALAARKIARQGSVRIVNTHHKIAKGKNTPLYRRIYRNVDAHIFLSSIAKQRFLSSWPKESIPFNPQRIHILHPSVNRNIGESPIPTPGQGAVTAIFRGSLLPGQGLETLIDAMALLKNSKIRLHIVGSGNPDYMDTLRQRAIMRGVMERIDWRKPADDFISDMQRAHFGVAPANIEWGGGHDNILYMAAGRAHIATNCGAPAELLSDHKEAVLIPPNNASALADAMRLLADNPALRDDIAGKALLYFRARLSWDSFSKRLLHLYIP